MSSSRTISPSSPSPKFMPIPVPPPPSPGSVNSTRDHEAGSGSSARLIYSEAIFRVPPLGGEPPKEEVLDKRITIIGRRARYPADRSNEVLNAPARSKGTAQSVRRSYKLDSGNILDTLKPPETTIIRFRCTEFSAARMEIRKEIIRSE